ncbi:MAG: hypothetical protein II969_10015 [Anaerolineaceae bacterium]|nr:hypothetical protein [Anaerolineaceae bacterium]
MDLVHELLEDLFSSSDREGRIISGAVIPGTEKTIVCSRGYPGKSVRLSNGLLLPADYTEQDYALACRTVCVAYEVTPCEMTIEFAESTESCTIFAEQPAVAEAIPEPETETEESSGTYCGNQEENPLISFPDFGDNDVSDMMIAPPADEKLTSLSTAEEMWMKLLVNNESQKPSDRIQVTAYNDDNEEITEELDWDTIIDRLKHDNQAVSAAKLIKKSGIKPPTAMNFRGIKQFNKVGAEALFVWLDEGIAYLHERQKYGKGYFLERNFSFVITDDPRALIKCFRMLEAADE